MYQNLMKSFMLNCALWYHVYQPCRELSKKAQKANNVWWRLSGLLGEQNRQMMYILLQAVFTVATMALTVPIFLCYEMHVIFQILKVSAAIWNGGNFLLEVMPRQVVLKEKKKLEIQPLTILEQPLEQQFLAPDIIQASGEWQSSQTNSYYFLIESNYWVLFCFFNLIICEFVQWFIIFFPKSKISAGVSVTHYFEREACNFTNYWNIKIFSLCVELVLLPL